MEQFWNLHFVQRINNIITIIKPTKNSNQATNQQANQTDTQNVVSFGW